MTVFEYASILMLVISAIAVIVSPMIALSMSRTIERRREESDRRYQVFRTLMKTRAIRLEPDHVSALNLVDLEFYNDEKVRGAFQSYIQHLGSPMPALKEQKRYFDDRDDLFVEMMKQMGVAVGLTFDKHELSRLSYAPQGWEDDRTIQRNNSIMLSQILNGERALPISQFTGQTSSPFPERPRIEDKRGEQEE